MITQTNYHPWKWLSTNKHWNLGFTADLQLRFMVIITYQLHIITIVGWACQLKTRWHHLIGSEVSTIGVLHFVHFICWNFWGSRNQQPRPGIVPSDYPWYWVAFGWISDLKLDVLAALGRFATPIRSNVTWSSQPLRPLGSLDFFWVKVEVFQEDLKARRMRGTMFEQRVRTWSCFAASIPHEVALLPANLPYLSIFHHCSSWIRPTPGKSPQFSQRSPTGCPRGHSAVATSADVPARRAAAVLWRCLGSKSCRFHHGLVMLICYLVILVSHYPKKIWL